MAANTLALALSRTVQKRDSAALPLPFTRLHGQENAQDGIATPSTPKQYAVVGAWGIYSSPVRTTRFCQNAHYQEQAIQSATSAQWLSLGAVARCAKSTTQGMQPLAVCLDAVKSKPLLPLANCGIAHISGMGFLQQCTQTTTGTHAFFAHCVANKNTTTLAYQHCAKSQSNTSRLFRRCVPAQNNIAHFQAACRENIHTPVRMPPCEYYPIALPEPIKPEIRPCGPRARAHILPLAFVRRRLLHDAGELPLAFSCSQVARIPNRKVYMIHNQVIAQCGNVVLDVLSASLSTDMDSFCWQGSITLYPSDFAKLNTDTRAVGDEAEITIKFGVHTFIFLAENISDNREFAKKTYTVSGRSITAKLSADYAKTKSGSITSELYARQLADAQLALLPFKISHWSAADWLIKANSYTIDAKTPIDVIADIADACGAFVESHPFKPWLNIKPRWKTAAWQIKDQTPEHTIPASVVVSMSGQKRSQARANSVYVLCSHENGVGADVYRQSSDKLPRLGTISHALYTDLPALQSAGMAALSDSGRHKIETITLPVADDYAVPLGRLGALWQINEATGAFKGVVSAVNVVFSTENNIPKIMQTVVLDCYLDD